MIEYRRGDLFASGAVALVNTVNCVGVMGKGVALQFKQRFPENYEAYRNECRKGSLVPGGVFQFYDHARQVHILNVATKNHWRNPSQLSWVEQGANLLALVCVSLKLDKVAVPPLGCGNGGLNWNDVRPMIDAAFRPLPSVTALVYEP